MIIGWDIGGTKCAVSVGELRDGVMTLLKKEVFPTRETATPSATLRRLAEIGRRLCPAPEAVGISAGGPLDAARGIILSPPNLPGWDEVRITEYASSVFDAPSYLQNDADACALAEWKYGAGVGCRSMVFLTCGTGLGAGLILNGQLYSGACGMAGEVGHMRLSPFGPVGYGKAGSFEGFCSGGGIAELGKLYAAEALQMGQKLSYCGSADELGKITTRSLAEHAARGEADAVRVFDAAAEKLGQGLSVLIDLLNPEAIVLGSVFVRAESLLRPRMEEVIARECLPASRAACRILPARLGETLGDMAALTVAANGTENERMKKQ